MLKLLGLGSLLLSVVVFGFGAFSLMKKSYNFRKTLFYFIASLVLGLIWFILKNFIY